MINKHRLTRPNAGNQENQQETVRKFGNIVNRVDKSPKSNTNKETTSNFKNNKRLQDNKSFVHLQGKMKQTNKFTNDNSLGLHELRSQNDDPKQGKDSLNKNRQFVLKVQNINKIHEQINSMLKYVKSDQSKSKIKYEQNAYPRQKVNKQQDKADRIIKQRIKQIETQTRSGQRTDNRYAENQIFVPITQNSNLCIQNGQYQNTKFGVQHQRRVKLTKQFSFNQKNKFQQLSPCKKYIQNAQITTKYTQNQRETDHYTEFKRDMRQFTPKKMSYKNLTGAKQYNYNFQNIEDQVENSATNSQYLQGNFDYDDYNIEISKIKNRIEQSEQQTKNMKHKYLGSQFSQTNNYTRSPNRPVRQPIESKIVYTPDLQQQKVKNSTDYSKSYKKRNVQDSLDAEQFEIKVYPCKQYIQQPMKRSEICKIISQKFSQQIKLDQVLRDTRQLFNDLSSKDKWDQLKIQLQNLGYFFSVSDLEKQFMISANESNPFNNLPSSNKSCVSYLAEAYAESQNHWSNKLHHFLGKNTIQKSGFNAKQMDLDHRGYISIEDLVCFINLYSNNYFRNRDAIHIFKRIVSLGKNTNGIQYQDFIAAIST